MKVLNVWHIGAWNRNIGDWALAYQLHRLLNEQGRSRDLALKFYLVDSQRTYFHRALVDQMNEEADLILVGGGGLIFFRPEDNSVSGWSFNIEPEKVRGIKKQLVVYSVGYNRFGFDQAEFPEATGPHLRLIQSKASLFSVRNTGTRRTLIEQYGLNADKLDVVPDPGICLYDRPIDIAKKREGAPIIAVNWAGDRPHLRYPKPHEENASYFLNTLKKALLRCVEAAGAQIMFFPHLMNVDSDMYDEFAAGFPQGSIFSVHRELQYLYAPPGEMLYPHVPFFTNVFRQADILIGTGLTRYNLPLVDPNRETADEMYRIISGCLKDESYKHQVRISLDRELRKLRAFNERVLDLVS